MGRGSHGVRRPQWAALTLVALLALGIAGCGKKPSSDLLIPQAEDETEQFPRTYPSS